MYRLVYQAIAHASILVLLIVSVATHFVMDGMALVAFGPDGARTASFSDARFDLYGESVAVQSVVVLGVSVILVLVLFSYAALYAIVCYGVILLTGVAGQVSFGQAAFVGVGAYTSAVLTTSCAAGGALRNVLGDGASHVLSARSTWVEGGQAKASRHERPTAPAEARWEADGLHAGIV